MCSHLCHDGIPMRQLSAAVAVELSLSEEKFRSSIPITGEDISQRGGMCPSLKLTRPLRLVAMLLDQIPS
jgi:hypothetical protein